MSHTQANDYLEKEELGRLMRKYSVPCIISLLVGALYNIVDQIFIANASYLGSYGNAANTVVFPLTVVALAVATMIGDGCCAFVSLSLGAKQRDNAHRGVGSSIVAIVVSSLVITAVYLLFCDQILTAFGATVNAETFALSREYFIYISLGIPFYMFGQALNPIIRSDGSPRFAMLSLLTGAILNVILDPIFIFVFRWGMMGAAVATVIGQAAAAALALGYLFRMKSVRLSRDSFRFRFSLIRRIVPLGVTSFLSQISMVLSMAAVLNMLTKYGAMDEVFGQEQYAQIPTAVVGIVMKFFQIVISISIGLAAGCIPIVGYNIGAGRRDRASGLLTRLLLAEAAVGAVALLIFEAFPSQLIGVFGAKSESSYYTDFAVRCIRIFLSMIVLSCINKGMTIFLQSLGKARESTLLSVLREVVCGVGLPLLLPVFFGLDGILYFMALADIITFVVSIFAITATYRALGSGLPGGEKLREAWRALRGRLSGGIDRLRGQRAVEPLDTAGEASSVPEAQPDTLAAEPPAVSTVITIGRSYGAGGRTIGRLLARRLRIPYYDAQLLEEAAKASGLSRKYLESIDEKAKEPAMLYRRVGPFFGDCASMEEMAARAQTEIIERVAAQGPCVIVGRRADRILRGKADMLSVFITASPELRAQHIMHRDGLSRQESLRKLARVDKERAAYYNLVSDDGWGVASTYDLCIGADAIGEERAVELIVAALS